jgi:hypothetical protein
MNFAKTATIFLSVFMVFSCSKKAPIIEENNNSWILSESGIVGFSAQIKDFSTLEESLLDLKKQLSFQKETLIEGGPEFTFATISQSDNVIFKIISDYENLNLIYQIFTESPQVIDIYGVYVGMTLEEAIEKRENMEYHADEHLNVFGIVKNSQIGYQLKGTMNSLDAENDQYVAEDYSVEREQLTEMVIEKIIWYRK